MRLLPSIFLGCFGFLALAQINTDRPTQSFSPHVMPKSGLQLEAGFLSERPFKNVDLYNVTYVNALVRYGLLDNVELRLTQNYVGERSLSAINGVSPTTIGTKIHLHEQTGGLPQIGLIASVTLTNGDEAFAPNESIQDIRLLFQNDLSDKLTLAYNFGAFWSGSGTAVGIYTVMLGISASDKMSFFVEPYGFFEKDTLADARFNAGLTYLVNDNFQLDLSAGNALSNLAPDYFVSFGAAVLF